MCSKIQNWKRTHERTSWTTSSGSATGEDEMAHIWRRRVKVIMGRKLGISMAAFLCVKQRRQKQRRQRQRRQKQRIEFGSDDDEERGKECWFL